MKILADTNIFIPLEPISIKADTYNRHNAIEFFRMTNFQGIKLYYHPYIDYDFKRDRDENRVLVRKELIHKYQLLIDPPKVNDEIESVLGKAAPGTNDWVDNHLLTALYKDAVDYLVTEDNDIHRKAKLLSLNERVLRLTEVISVLNDLFDKYPIPPPAVKNEKAYLLNEDDPIFRSFHDFYPGFENWLKKCKREQRDTYVIRSDGNSQIAGFTILKNEANNDYGLKGKILKICSFKVSEKYNGNRYGELLLKSIFDYAEANKYEYLYLTIFSKLEPLISLMNKFGFEKGNVKTRLGEQILIKKQKYSNDDVNNIDPLEFNRLYGPWKTVFVKNQSYVIPIKNVFHNILFPEYDKQPKLFLGEYKPCGNSIRKAYLSHAVIKNIKSGDNIFFYRSGSERGITALGIVEDTLRDNKTDVIARHVGTRTVYSYDDIRNMCNKRNVLAVCFRRVRFAKPVINYADLIKHCVLNGPPQSIQQIKSEGLEWLRAKMKI